MITSMTTEKFMDYIGQIDESIIDEAECSNLKLNFGERRTWVKWAAAACLVVAVPYLIKQRRDAA